MSQNHHYLTLVSIGATIDRWRSPRAEHKLEPADFIAYIAGLIGSQPHVTTAQQIIRLIGSQPHPSAAQAQPAPLNTHIAIPEGVPPRAAEALVGFANALAEKLRRNEEKYRYGDSWHSLEWESDLHREMTDHLAKGDPKDVALYAMFAWARGWNTRLELSGVPDLASTNGLLQSARDELAQLRTEVDSFQEKEAMRVQVLQWQAGRIQELEAKVKELEGLLEDQTVDYHMQVGSLEAQNQNLRDELPKPISPGKSPASIDRSALTKPKRMVEAIKARLQPNTDYTRQTLYQLSGETPSGPHEHEVLTLLAQHYGPAWKVNKADKPHIYRWEPDKAEPRQAKTPEVAASGVEGNAPDLEEIAPPQPPAEKPLSEQSRARLARLEAYSWALGAHLAIHTGVAVAARAWLTEKTGDKLSNPEDLQHIFQLLAQRYPDQFESFRDTKTFGHPILVRLNAISAPASQMGELRSVGEEEYTPELRAEMERMAAVKAGLQRSTTSKREASYPDPDPDRTLWLEFCAKHKRMSTLERDMRDATAHSKEARARTWGEVERELEGMKHLSKTDRDYARDYLKAVGV